jgi:uncharacterized protein
LAVERIVLCVPGAELIETVDDRTWRGTVRVRFAPSSWRSREWPPWWSAMTAPAAWRCSRKARQGKERKGSGERERTSWMEERVDGLTTVRLATDVTLTGAVAQLSRGLLPEVSKKLT